MTSGKSKNFSEDKKEKKFQYHRDQNKNLSEKKRKKMRNYYLAHKK